MTKAEHVRLVTWRSKILQHAADEHRTVAHTCRYFGTATRGAPHSPRLPPTATGVTMSRLLNRASGGSKDRRAGRHSHQGEPIARDRDVPHRMDHSRPAPAHSRHQQRPWGTHRRISAAFELSCARRMCGISPRSPRTVVVVGAPVDQGTSNRPGQRYGPRDMREASLILRVGSREWLLLHRHRADGLDGCAVGSTSATWTSCPAAWSAHRGTSPPSWRRSSSGVRSR